MLCKGYHLIGLTAALLVFSGCGYELPRTGPLTTEPVHIDSKGAEYANVELNVAAGELNLRGGAAQLIDGTISYNIPAYRPVIQESMNGSHAVVNIRESSRDGWGGAGHNTWNFALNDKVVVDLSVNFGAGQAEMHLGDVTLRSLQVQMGAGQMDLDLRGHPSRDYDVKISGGVGQATIHLPSEVGIRADAHGGIGNISVTGLEKRGDHYENNAYDKAKTNIHLTVDGGIGEIDIIG